MELKLSKVYVPTDVKIELPNKDGTYCVLSKCNVSYPLQTYDSLRFQQGIFQEIPNWKHIHWLKEQTIYTLTKEELERVITDAWVKGWDNCDGASKINLEQYLNQILK